MTHKNAIIIGAGSDIGLALAHAWKTQGFTLSGTSRQMPEKLKQARDLFAHLLPCDLTDARSIDACTKSFAQQKTAWDVLVFCPGTLEPIERFDRCDMDAWEKGLQVNFTGQLRLLHGLLALRNRAGGELPLVLFFAGGGTNSAPLHFSSYTLSKIALIKAVELLDHEFPDIRFSIVGPGWVDTKIHEETLRAGDTASAGSASETRRRIADGDFVPMSRVVECCNWILGSPKSVIGGRNFSVAHDKWGEADLEKELQSDTHKYKLRRFGNDWR